MTSWDHALMGIPAAALFLAAAAGYVVAAGRQARRLTVATKPFVVPLLALAYLLVTRGPNPWILGGLACGLVGDVFLIWPERKGFFAAGLAAFLVGHLAYLAALLGPVFAGRRFPVAVFAACIPLATAGVLVYRPLRPRLGSLKLPVAFYMGVILAMGFAAVIRVAAMPGLPSWLILLGALLFMASDALLAFRRFRGGLRFASTLIAASYVGAQTLIVVGFLAEAGWRGP